MQRALTLTQQLAYYREWQGRVVDLVGRAKADEIFSGAIHLISAGTSDFVQNYYINPILNTLFSTDHFSNSLIESYSNFIQVSNSLTEQFFYNHPSLLELIHTKNINSLWAEFIQSWC